MSTTIDQKVVEMRFDNRHFEKNTRETMSTLDKLKQKLNLSGASKGLENLNTSVNKVNMSGLSNAIDTAHSKFSALEVIGVTALAKITSAAMDAGTRIVKALTIDPITSGFSEYETKMGSIQTILANTEHQGTTLDDVTAALEELNTYADKTIYNFQEMTRNIGTFTAAGVDLNTSVQSIKGIANIAAVSGSTSQQASTAMYQLSQALASGTVKLQDWNSVVNAGMGGKVFQNALIRTAAMLDGSAKNVEAWQKKNVDSYGSFRESLSQGAWLTTEVLTETLKQFTMAAEQGSEEWEEFKKSLMSQGYTEAQANEILKMANTATDAATKVKTFTQLFDTLKETAQSGWAQTWEIIFGDFEEAKDFFTSLSDMIGGLIDSMSKFRNNMLGGALDSNWDKLISKLNKAGVKTTEFEEAIRNVWKASGKTDEELDALIEEFGSLEKAIRKGKISSDILKKALDSLNGTTGSSNEKIAGFVEGLNKISRTLRRGNVGDDVKKLQTALHELGYDLGKPGIDGIIGPITEKAIKEFQKEAGLVVDGIAGPKTLAALKQAGKSIDKISNKVGDIDEDYGDLIDNLTKKGGRELLLESFSNIINGLTGSLKAIGSAWAQIFPASDAERRIYSIIEGFNEFTQSLRLFETVTDENGNTITKFNENGDKLVRTFKGIFAVVDVVTSVIGGPLTIALKLVLKILKYFDLNILDVTAAIGDALVKFRDWFDSIFDISWVLDLIVPKIEKAIDAIKRWFGKFDGISEFGDKIKTALSNIGDAFGGVPKQIIVGLANGLKGGAKTVINSIIELGKKLLAGICKILGIESPSKAFFTIGTMIILGLVGGIKDGFSAVGDVFKNLFGSLSNLGWSQLAAVMTFVTSLIPGLSKLNIVATFSRMMAAVGTESMSGLLGGLKNSFSIVIGFITSLGKSILGAICKVLGIQSPSKEFYKIGSHVIQGFVNGVKNGLSKVGTVLKQVGTKCIEVIKSIDWGKIFAAGLSIGLMYLGKTMLSTIDNISEAVSNLAKAVKSFAAPLEGFGKMLTSLGDAAEDFAKGYKIGKQGKAIRDIAIAIAILAVSIYVLAKIKPGTLWTAVLAVAALAAIIGVLALAMSAMDKISGGTKTVLSAATITSIGIALLLLAKTLKTLSDIKPERMKQAIGGLVAVIVALGALIVAMGKCTNAGNIKNIAQIGNMIKKIAIALLIMVAVIKLSSMLNSREIFKGIFVIGVFGVFVASLIAVSHLAGDNAKQAGKMISKISFALLIMVGVIKLASMLSASEIARGLEVVIKVGLLFAAIIAVSKLAGDKATKAGWMILQMALALGITVGVVKLASMLDGEAIGRGLTVIIGLGLLFAALVAVSKNAGANAIKAGTMLLQASVALLITVGVLFILSKMSPEKLMPALGIIAVLELLMAGLIRASKGVGDTAKSIYALIAALGVLVLSVFLLSLMDPEKLANTSQCLTALMLGLAALVASTKVIDNRKGVFKNILKTILPLVGVVALLAVIFGLMSKLNVSASIPTAIALSILLNSMASALVILSNVSAKAKKSLGAMGILVPIVAGLAAILGVMSYFNVSASIPTALALSVLLNGMSAALIILSKVGSVSAKSVLALTTMLVVVAGLAAILGVMSHLNVEASIPTAIALSTLLIGMSAALILLGVVGAMGPAAFIGIGALLTLIASLVLLVVAIGALMQMPALQQFLDTGIAMLVKLAGGIGEMVGAFAKGIAIQVLGILPALGANLSLFMTNAKGFIEGAKLVDFNVLTGVGILVASILALAASSLITGVVSLLTLGSSFADLGTELSNFMINALPFLATATTINPDVVNGVKALAEAILMLTVADLLDGINLFSKTPLEKFADQLPLLGTGLKGFIDTLGTISDDQVTTAVNAANIIKTLAEAAREIPNSGGLLGSLVGNNDMGPWAEQLPVMAQGIADFINVMAENKIESKSVKVADTAASMIKTLASAASEIPNAGGLLADLIGDNDLTLFSAGLPIVGAGIAGFIKILREAELSQDDVSIASSAAEVIKSLASAAKDVPNTGGLLADLIGDNSLTSFAEGLPDVGTGIAGFASNLGVFDDSKLATVTAATKAIEVIANMSKNYDKKDSKDFTGFGDGLTTLVTKIGEFVTSMGNIGADAINSAIDNVNKIFDFTTSISSVNLDTLKQFGDSLKTIANEGVAKFINAFNSSKILSDAKKACEDLIASITDAAENKKTTVEEKFEEIGDKAIDGLTKKEFKTSATQAGKDICQGLINGLKDKNKRNEVYQAAYSLGQLAVQGEHDGQESNSPSKATERAGKWLGEGLIIGIRKIGGKVYDAGKSMGSEATNSISNALNTAMKLINSDMDTQPTIRPVLDLSDVENGASYLNSMFNNDPSLGVSSNLNAISYGMNHRVQNGANDDVVSAINKLRTDLGNIGGNTYNVNGITYDDGSNITNAVRDLIRAAQVERRI